MIKDYLKENQKMVEATLSQALVSPNKEYGLLYESMNYSLLMGGKRIRPILTKAVMDALSINSEDYESIICAIELIHSYSLIHDDLPAMDDDEYRRGKLTNHKVYGDGLAILAGDGLLTYAFQMICENTKATLEQKVAVIHSLSKAAGPEGMVGGQAFDLLSEGKKLSLEELKTLHRGKTGALFRAAVEVGLILSNCDETIKKAFLSYAEELGLLFQITDDILDVTGTVEELGKTPGSDVREDKATYVSLLSLERAKEYAEETASNAKKALLSVPVKHDKLLELVDYLVSRTH